MIGTGFQVIAILALLCMVVLCAVLAAHRHKEAKFWFLVGVSLLAIAVSGALTLDQTMQ